MAIVTATYYDRPPLSGYHSEGREPAEYGRPMQRRWKSKESWFGITAGRRYRGMVDMRPKAGVTCRM